MSLYTRGVSAPAYGSRPPVKTRVVQITRVIPTPYGNAIAGEVVEGEYYPPGAYDVGFSLKGGLKKLGRGAKKVGKTTFKVATTPHRLVYKAHKAVAKGALKLGKKTGKVVFKGSKGAVKWVAKNPIKAAAFAVSAPLGLTYAAYKGGKAVARKITRKKGTQAALSPMEEEESMEASEDMSPESYPGESYESEAEAENEQPDVLEPPDAEEEEAEEEEESSEEESESDEGEEDADENAVEGERNNMREEEWVGLDEIAYDDDGVSGDEIAGSRRRPVGPNALQVRQRGYTKGRKQPLGFASTGTVAAGASATITVPPQTLFRGRKLSVPADIAPYFTIDQLLVGNTPQFAAAGALPADSFRADATGQDNLTMDSCPPGLVITMVVTNQDSSAHQFRATLFGDSAM